MKILITGGHFSPALAVIKVLPKDTEVLVVGRKHSFEGDTAPSYEYMVCEKLGIPFKSLTTGRLQRKLTKSTLLSIAKLPIGFAQAVKIMSDFKPDVVFTCGGYLALPVAYAARGQGVPIVVHEQTQGAGLTNKIIGKFAHTICTSFITSEKYFPKEKTILTGNPMRKELFEEKTPVLALKGKKMIYITGGSAGSHYINKYVKEILPQLLEDYVVIHQTGRSAEYKDFETMEDFSTTLPDNLRSRYIVRDFIFPDEIGWVLHNASLIIGRSGINTVYELLAFGKVCLLIPLPHGQKNEQKENAQLVRDTGIGDFIEQNDSLTSEKLLEKINSMFEHYDEYLQHAKDARKVAMLDADKHILSVIQSINEEKRSKEQKNSKTSSSGH